MNIDGRYLNHLRFAGDQILFNHDANELSEIIGELLKANSSEFGLHIDVIEITENLAGRMNKI